MNENQGTNYWNIQEDSFQAENQLKAESCFGLGNGNIGQRGNFEEYYSGPTHLGTYVAEIFKNVAENTNSKEPQLSNLPDCTSLQLRLNSELVDLYSCEIRNFKRVLDMKHGLLERSFEISTANNHEIEVNVKRFLSLAQPEILAIKYSVKSLNFAGKISFNPIIDGNFNSSKEESEWNVLQSKAQREVAHLWVQTQKTNFHVCEAMSFNFFKNNVQTKINPTKIEKQKVVGFSFGADVKVGEKLSVHKFVAILSSLKYPYQELTTLACTNALEAKSLGWEQLLEENNQAWEQKWKILNPKIETKAIRNEFKKFQPYTICD